VEPRSEVQKFPHFDGEGQLGVKDFSSETILRSLIVMTVEGLSYRGTFVRIADSEFSQDFTEQIQIIATEFFEFLS
jgi:hypothetical protein